MEQDKTHLLGMELAGLTTSIFSPGFFQLVIGKAAQLTVESGEDSSSISATAEKLMAGIEQLIYEDDELTNITALVSLIIQLVKLFSSSPATLQRQVHDINTSTDLNDYYSRVAKAATDVIKSAHRHTDSDDYH